MTGPHDMTEPPEETAYAWIRLARSRLEQLTAIHPGADEKHIKDQLFGAATELADGRNVMAEWHDAYAVHSSAPDAARNVPQKTLDVLSVYEATPEPKRFELVIQALAVFSPATRYGAT